MIEKFSEIIMNNNKFDDIIPRFMKKESFSEIKQMIPNFEGKIEEQNIYDKNEMHSLLEEKKNDIQEKTGWSDDQIKKCTINEDGVIHYKCDNEYLEGKIHEPSGVEYVKKIIDVNGVKAEVIVPDFDSRFDLKLSGDILKESNPRQFKECNRQLKSAIYKDTELRNKFTDGQIEDIIDEKTPEGFTWHHDAEIGEMKLVETKIHDRTQGGAAHTGGKSIWGGGYRA